ncbi:MAG: DUF1080 domain-containing protein [Bryobacterales bacterium]|nr:DUF1080 domain-containing protein [Bryobacterales bacterium]
MIQPTRRHLLAALAAAAATSKTLPAADFKPVEWGPVVDGPDSAFQRNGSEVVVHPGSNFPAWLRSRQMYENFHLKGEFFLKGWMDSAIYLHAPRYGRPGWSGLEVKIFHQQEEKPTPYSCGSLFPLIAPKTIKLNNKGEWNTVEIVMDWPKLKVTMNDAVVQDFDLTSHPEFRYRLQRGYLGLQSLSYPIRYRNFSIQELPAKEKWTNLYSTAADAAQWELSEGKPRMEALGDILRLEGLGHLRTKSQYQDFELHSYIRTSRQHNGGFIFRSEGRGTRGARSYEIQLHNVEGAHFPTGSLYHYKRATYPRIQDEKWFLYQMVVKGKTCLVRINGETVMEYDQLENTQPGYLELQAHHEGTWMELRELKIKPA